MKICIITSKYPTNVDKTALTFVQQLAWAMADESVDVCVICPLPININRKFVKVPFKAIEKTYKKNKVEVFFPKYIGFGQQEILFFNTAFFTTISFTHAVQSVINRLNNKPDILYGHFVTPAGIAACKIAKKLNLKAFIAYGESSTWSIDHYGRKRVKKAIDNVNGVIAVSTKNKTEIVSTEIVRSDQVEIFPNGYLPERFYKKNKTEARNKFGLPQNDFIIAFVGHFIKRKGFDILNEVVDSLDDIYMICAGKGKLSVTSKNVLFADLVSPNDLCDFYNAADVFVLPTINEGCCNAIIEAMACGLPIVSSNCSFNYDILDSNNAILVDPMDKNDIRNAIEFLKKNKMKRELMGEKSLERAKHLTLQKRAKNILNYIERLM